MEKKNIWYAVLRDNDDNDWGTGSYNHGEAVMMVLKYKAWGYHDAYIAIIEEGKDPVCIGVER